MLAKCIYNSRHARGRCSATCARMLRVMAADGHAASASARSRWWGVGGDRAVVAKTVRLMRNCEPVAASIPNGNSRCTCADQLASCGRTVLLLPLEWRVSGVGVLVGLANRQASSIVPKRRGRCETTHRSCLLDVYATRDTREVAVQPRALECCGSWPRTGTRRRRLLHLAGGAWGGIVL